MKFCCTFLHFVICIKGVDNYSYILPGQMMCTKTGSPKSTFLDALGHCTNQVFKQNMSILHLLIITNSSFTLILCTNNDVNIFHRGICLWGFAMRGVVINWC